MTPSRLLICNNATELSYELARICNPCHQFHASWRGFAIRATQQAIAFMRAGADL